MFTSFCRDIYQMLCEKYPNRKIYVIGDHHFFHENILRYTRDNFSSVLEMNQFIIEEHNSVVGEEDIVIFLGDFSFKDNLIGNTLKQLHGHKYLIVGNHDNENIVKKYPSLGFEGVFTSPIKIKNDYLSHEPLIEGERVDLQFQCIMNEFKKRIDSTNYHGHIHREDPTLPSSYRNVTCEVLHYKPYLLGETISFIKEDMPLFINSDCFEQVLSSVSKEHNIDISLLLSDYIYSSMLEACFSFREQFFVQGSFGLLKKYDYLSRMSDLDLSFLYDSFLSKGANISTFKDMVDHVYEALKSINGINLSFIKRYSSLRIFESSYTTKTSFFNGYFDANLLFLDCYKKSDFIHLNGGSIIQKYLQNRESSLLNEFHFPKFSSQTLTAVGDISNLLLQFLFELGNPNKKQVILKKLQYVYNRTYKKQKIEDLENVLIRMFLRNITLLSTMNRYKEIEYIQQLNYRKMDLFSSLPKDLQDQIYDVLGQENTLFSSILEEINSVSAKDVIQKSSELVKKFKS